MDLVSNIALGFSTALSLSNLAYCFVGVLLGTAVGVLPGLGPVATISMLLPLTFGLEPTGAVIMLAGIYYGAQYGGSTTAILVNVPGEATSIATAIDGFKMAQLGQGGKALAVAAIGSFVAGTLATGLVAAFAEPLTAVALDFGPAEYFSLMVLGLVASVVLTSGSLFHSFAALLVGMLLGTIGIDMNSGTYRFTFGLPELADGLGFIIVAMGFYGVSEIITNLEHARKPTAVAKVTNLLLSMREWRQIIGPILRGTVLGSFLGILPGGGVLLASFASYAVEKKLARDPSRFGNGAIEGVAAPEAANNAAAQTSFIPMLTLGIPSNAVLALMIGALIVQGIQPGPSMIVDQPSLFWGLVASMWIGNVMLLVLNLPLIGLWVRMVSIPYKYLYPIIMVFCAIGVFSVNNSEFDILLLGLFGVVGYVLRKLGSEPAPLLLGLILGPSMEEYLRRALILSRGDASVFVTQPISAVLLALAAVAIVIVLLPALRKKRDEVLIED